MEESLSMSNENEYCTANEFNISKEPIYSDEKKSEVKFRETRSKLNQLETLEMEQILQEQINSLAINDPFKLNIDKNNDI